MAATLVTYAHDHNVQILTCLIDFILYIWDPDPVVTD